MSRGDQRERDRAKKQAKLAKSQKAGPKEGRPEDRNAADKAKLEAKIAAKKEKEAKEAQEAAQGSGRAPVARKKKPVKKDSLDDLLDAGLTKGKKK